MYQLRGHHLLCLLGYRGMGYSKEYAENMTRLHQTLRTNPTTDIQLVDGPDQLCEKFPDSIEYHCHNESVYERDAKILEKMNLRIGQILQWKDIESRIRLHIHSGDLKTICTSCSWRSFGVCEEGIQRIHEKKGLTKVN